MVVSNNYHDLIICAVQQYQTLLQAYRKLQQNTHTHKDEMNTSLSCQTTSVRRLTSRCGMMLLMLLILMSGTTTSALEEEEPATERQTKKRKGVSLAESIQKSQSKFRHDRADTMRKYWSKTFKEIRDLEVFSPETAPLLTQWKALSSSSSTTSTDEATATTTTEASDETTTTEKIQQVAMSPSAPRKFAQGSTPKRFDGFRSWERLVQEWTEDVADYIEKNTVESASYPMSTYGRPQAEEQEDPSSVKQEEEPVDEPTEILIDAVPMGSDAAAADTLGVSPVPSLVLDAVTAQEDVAQQIGPQGPFPRTVQSGEAVLAHTDIADLTKSIWIVTTASLPWMTGTAVNPLLRAAYLQLGREARKVTLMLPFLETKDDQERVYGGRVFETPQDQEDHVRGWLRESAKMEEAASNLNIAWYPARQEQAENSIYSMGDITALIPADEVDICILEEPEHLNWYRAPGENWTTKFKHVVGIIHTNYFVYAQEQPAAFIRAPSMKFLCSWMCRAHCHRLIKLSGTLDKFAPEKELVENVHGVRGTFLESGEEVRKILVARDAADHAVFGPTAEPTVYFIGKMLWSKGLGSLMELLKYAEESAGLKLHVDMFGGGPDKDAAETKSSKLGIDMEYHGPVDHSKLSMSHKIFVNPSTSEVLCTTSAEALAMGKFVVLPSHPSNDFFAQFPNCLPYTNKEEFVGNLYYAMTHSPAPLIEEYAYALSWKAATERLAAAGSISEKEAAYMETALVSRETGVEIDLPPLIDDDEQRRKIVSTFRLSRSRYRQFRSRLSDEIKQSSFLPQDIRKRLSGELDKRLDLDLDTVLESPKLRLQLSPAELDKQLLDFYNDVIKGTSGDLLRVLSGGKNVGMQNLYMKNQASRQRHRERKGLAYDSSLILNNHLPSYDDAVADDPMDEKEQTPTQRVTLALRRNLPAKRNGSTTTSSSSSVNSISKAPKNESTTKMCVPLPTAKLPKRQWTNSPLI